ncbi:MAG: hypothetical protein ACKVOM_04500 [Ferruginibacter sp.]
MSADGEAWARKHFSTLVSRYSLQSFYLPMADEKGFPLLSGLRSAVNVYRTFICVRVALLTKDQYLQH